jgi:competence protein ComEC
MLFSTLSFAAGIIVVQQFSNLPSNLWLIFLLLLLLGLAFFRYWKVFFFILGVSWAIIFASLRLADGLPEPLQGQKIKLEGKVIGLPQHDERRVRFDFVVSKSKMAILDKIRLSWFFPKQEIKAGQYWRFTAKLKKPHGRLNPGGFDYERWLFVNNIGATGYVRNKPQPVKIASIPWWQSTTVIRQEISDKLDVFLEDNKSLGVIKALAIGERQGIDQDQWAVYKDTGTVHLLAISGLHIGLVSGLVYLLVFNACVLFSVASPQKMAAVGAIVVALFYSALAGFSLPTQRSLVMLSIAMLAISWQRNNTAVNTIAFTLFAVLVFDPLAVLSAGFWLSFFAVAMIVFSLAGRLGKPAYWLSAIKIHWVTALGLTPFLVYFFQQISIISPLANLFTVPLISLVVVPLCLLAVITLFLLPELADKLFYLLSQILQNLEMILTELSMLPYAAINTATPAFYAIPFAVLGVFIILSPRGIPARWLGGVMLMPLFWVDDQQSPGLGEMSLIVFDVGQGLSAMVETSQHILVFDTGAKYSSQYDMGSAVVIPYLKTMGITSVDTLLVSHGDNDHIGGAKSIVEQTQVKEILTSVPSLLAKQTSVQCKAGQQWTWDQVKFEILSPAQGLFKGDNNNSCVLKVSSSYSSVLLTGDIEEPAEEWLISNMATKLGSDVLIAPHHGSKTSSTLAFLKQVKPKIILIPAGYKNRFSFPHQEVLDRYRQLEIPWMNTADRGALEVKFENGSFNIKSAREQQGKYWNK